MATATCQLSEDQFLCSICLDVFINPVTLPCGHNFCKTCIDHHWSIETTSKCPYCKQVFNPKPDLRVNIFISEMAEQFRQSQITNSSQLQTNADEVFCDFCTDPKSMALKCCLDCQSSFCESHLEPHLTIEILQTHKLFDLQRNLECKVEERTASRTDPEIQEMIAMRQHTIKELCHLMELNNKDANIEITNAIQAFTALKEYVEKDLDNLIQDITRKKKTTEDNAKGFIKDLEQEMTELKTGARTVTKDWANLNIRKPTYEGITVRAMAQLDQKISQQMSRAFIFELQRVQKYYVYVILEPDKVHPKSSNQSNTKRSDNRPECKCVLASQSFSAGKFYFEVDVKSRSKWVLGVAKELHVNKEVALSPRNTYWTICMRNKQEWYAGCEPSVRLSLKSRPEKVGVFVDYEEGLVSFYDANQAGLIYTFTGCNFTHKVHPFFSPCENDGAQLHTLPDSSCVVQ
ncbi:nuclear factor 7, brain-like [Boleophthalmus pectinirostris]|uniref:nuclear factor 7, brain-like n=1 Tax=Boleophthalmus pectinirostris TaxID=150288 RepID=UPI000A1C5FAF|nr:nuclear factor 7, brain-like [Boleophthalmus pectinirostris]